MEWPPLGGGAVVGLESRLGSPGLGVPNSPAALAESHGSQGQSALCLIQKHVHLAAHSPARPLTPYLTALLSTQLPLACVVSHPEPTGPQKLTKKERERERVLASKRALSECPALLPHQHSDPMTYARFREQESKLPNSRGTLHVLSDSTHGAKNRAAVTWNSAQRQTGCCASSSVKLPAHCKQARGFFPHKHTHAEGVPAHAWGNVTGEPRCVGGLLP